MAHIRKSFVDLTNTERDAFLAALLELKARPAPESDPTAPPNEQFSLYDQFVAIHTAAVRVRSPLSPTTTHNLGHRGPVFLPWHRQFLLRLQRQLFAVDENVVLPYWDWTAHQATMARLFRDDFLGASATSGGPQPLAGGYFAKDAPAGSSRPTWWPSGLAGWLLPQDLQLFTLTGGFDVDWQGVLHRQLAGLAELPDRDDLDAVLALGTYREFWSALETGMPEIGDNLPRPMHDQLHGWVGGHMSRPFVSPFDPVFSMNHCFVDYVWDRWQRDGHRGDAFYPKRDDWDGMGVPGDIPRNHLLNDPMYPWVGNATGYQTQNTTTRRFLPDLSEEPVRTPENVLQTDALPLDSDLNYVYAEPLVRFSRVKSILDTALARWEVRTGRPPAVKPAHRNAAFGWSNRDELRDGEAMSQRLIAPELIGVGRGEDTLLVTIMRRDVGVWPRMPHNGPYLEEEDIAAIATWIDRGCLDDVEPPAPNAFA